MQILYHIGLFSYWIAAVLASPFNEKARLFAEGRKNLYKKIASEYFPKLPVIWFHCSSVGEFEQARPIIEKIKLDGEPYQILVTFFSPSGYELRKDYGYADWVFYLPLDTIWDARRFVAAIKPFKVIFIKYEFWINFLRELHSRKIPTYIACAIFRPGQIFFRWYGWIMREALGYFDRIFVQNEDSVKLLSGIGVDNVEICGDTRFDRVDEILRKKSDGDSIVGTFSKPQRTIVAGSTWWDDECLIHDAMRSFVGKAKLVLVPHETDESHILKIEKLFSGYLSVRYSALSGISDTAEAEQLMSDARILIVDVVGILSVVYRYARFAYIGGGFTKSGIHNILEAATYGVPVVFGPEYGKFREACELIEAGGAVSVSAPSSLERVALLWLNDSAGEGESECEKASKVCREYVSSNLGAAKKIHDAILGVTA